MEKKGYEVMKEILMKGMSVLAAAALMSGMALAPDVSFAGADVKPVEDAHVIDADPDDPALDDDWWDALHSGAGAGTVMQLQDEGNDGTDNPEDPQNPMYEWFGVQKSNTASISFLKNSKGKLYEYRDLAGQKVYGYDTFQGACSHGKYSWHVLFNRKNNKCRVIKVNMSTHKVVKVSKVLPLDHGNDLTYDEQRGRLVAVHYEPHPLRLSVIDPNTLKVTKVKNLKTPTERVSGASTSFSKSIKGVTGIGYDEQNDEYIVAIMGTRHYMALDAETFRILRVIKVPDLPPYVRQGMTVKNGFIIRSHSAYNKKYNQNILYVYDSAGNFIKTAKLGTGYEIESVFFDGSRMFASTYRSYLKKKTKKVKVGKKKVKKAYYVLMRDNNIIRIKKY